MKLTKNMLREKYGVHNPHNLTTATKTKLFICYIAQDLGRGGHGAKWQVVSPYFATDPNAHWTDNGCKTFSVWGRENKAEKLQEALAWATGKYGITEWEQSPFGSYHPKGTMAKLQEKVQA